MADDLDLLDSLFQDTHSLQNNEKEAPKFKPKNLKKPSKPSIPKPQTLPHSQHADSLLGSHLDYSLSPCSRTDQFEGTSNAKTKLQPQRKKLSSASGSDEPSDINKTETPDHKIRANSDCKAPTSLSDLLDDTSLEPPSSAEPTVNLHPAPLTSEEIQANDESERNLEENTQQEKEDAPNLDDVFNFLDDNDPVFEMDEADKGDPTDKDYGGGGEEDKGRRAEKEKKIDDKMISRIRNRGSTDVDANGEEGSPEKKKKKLPHQIRRKRRKVDPALLEMPENEINPRQISIKNLILLAEFKEKKLNKEVASRSSTDDADSMPINRGEQEGYEFDFGGDEEERRRNDVAPQETFEPTVKNLNYHTYMNRSSSTRWTKAETELFYKGIRQFGTDFAMIQQLFPNRTRHQIKLKFKNEDRKHPMRLCDATTHRLTDNSQFEKVIKILEIQADEIPPEESEPSSQAAQAKREEEEKDDDQEENLETPPSDLDNSSKHESVPNDDLDAVFDFEDQEMMGQDEFVF